jgi:hypothetical protein
MAKGIYIQDKPNVLKTLGTLITIGILIGYSVWAVINNEQDPVYNSSKVESIVSEWKQDINNAGIDADTEIKTVDRILIVDSIPYGFLNSESTTDIMGRSDLSTRTIWILNRPMERDQLKALIYHELGHYVFKLDHEGTGDIMSTYIKEDNGYYAQNWTQLLPRYLQKCKEAS